MDLTTSGSGPELIVLMTEIHIKEIDNSKFSRMISQVIGKDRFQNLDLPMITAAPYHSG